MTVTVVEIVGMVAAKTVVTMVLKTTGVAEIVKVVIVETVGCGSEDSVESGSEEADGVDTDDGGYNVEGGRDVRGHGGGGGIYGDGGGV